MELGACDSESEESKVQCVERLLRSKLPGYIVSCMLAAGFDTLDTVARMDVGNQPGNSIQIIEEYISSNFPGDARYMHAPLLGSTCKFPPGHRIRIERFVQELRSSHVCHDLLNDAVRPATKKKKKNSEPEAAAAQAPAGEISALTESRTTSTIIPRLRQQINAWQKKLSDERLRSLQENVHYELTMKEEQAVVSCKLCSRNLILSSKHNKLILSNWTRHVSTCFKAPKEHNHIEKYFLNLPSQADKPCTSKSANVPSNSSSALLSSTSPTVTTVYANSATNLHVDPPPPSPPPPSSSSSSSSSSSTTSSSSSSSSSSPPAVAMSAIWPLAYSFVHQNMPQALPSLRTVQRIVHHEYEVMNEGEFRFDQLANHINSYKCARVIVIGEDATRLVARVDYDPETNRLVGFVLPEDSFKSSKISKYALVYIAQPLSPGVPAFPLACIGTDNKFTADILLKRWSHISRKYVAGAHHLQLVQSTYSKDQHGLRERDIDCRDKQNFDSVLRITSSSVMAQISQILDAKELNAHALIIFMRTLRDHYSDGAALFSPWKLGSQSCEKTFRAVRSMTTTFSTVINVGMLGLLRRLHRLQIQFRLEAESAQNGIRYPHCEKHNNKDGSNTRVTFSLQGVTDANIEDAVECGRKLAMKDIEMLGMELSLKRNMEVENESAGSIIPEAEEDDEELDDEEPPRSDVNEAELLKEACCAVDEEEVVSSLDDLKSAKLVEGDLLKQLVQMQEAVSYKKVQSGTSLSIYTKNPVQSSKTSKKCSRFVECGYFKKEKGFHQIAFLELEKSNLIQVLLLTKSRSVTPMPLFRLCAM
eukprot:Em0001g1762a